PQEVLALHEQRQLLAREYALLGQLFRRIGARQELGDPEQGVEVAQAALAVLDVGLDQIAALARLEMALVALGELARDEGLGALGGDLLAEAPVQGLEQGRLAADEARLEDGGEDGR